MLAQSMEDMLHPQLVPPTRTQIQPAIRAESNKGGTVSGGTMRGIGHAISFECDYCVTARRSGAKRDVACWRKACVAASANSSDGSAECIFKNITQRSFRKS